MPRRHDRVVIEREGRDRGKVFWITEMSSTAGEYWAGRLLTMLAAGNHDVPSGFFRWASKAVRRGSPCMVSVASTG
jgi:hypothetical protein